MSGPNVLPSRTCRRADSAVGFLDAEDLHRRLDVLDAKQEWVRTVNRQLRHGVELAAKAVALGIEIPDVGNNELTQIVREYLGGLIENSPLKDVIYAGERRVRSDLGVGAQARLIEGFRGSVPPDRHGRVRWPGGGSGGTTGPAARR